MKFSILHVSDLHRDLADEVGNSWLLESLSRDLEQFGPQDPPILRPRLCVVSGDLVYGVQPSTPNAEDELTRQFGQAEDFLIGLADRFFSGARERIILLPGNHDVSYSDVMRSCQRVDIPADASSRTSLVAELFKTSTRLRWSWSELCFFRIVDPDGYRNRFRQFAQLYTRFYQGTRSFSLTPSEQYAIFDFADLQFSVLALNSCHNNDPLRRAGAFDPTAVASACEALRKPHRTGWLFGAAWHHNLFGGPAQDDYLDAEVIQLLIDAGVSIGFHGHQHRSECVDERYRLGPRPRKMTVVSSGTLCAGPKTLSPGVPRSYNVIEIDTEAGTGRVHQRHMVNRLFNLPVWGPGHFDSTNRSFLDVSWSRPLQKRPEALDVQLVLEDAERLVRARQWDKAAALLEPLKSVSLARPLLAAALSEMGEPQKTIDALWPPETLAEAVTVGGAILAGGARHHAEAFVNLELISGSTDASIREIAQRVRERRLR